MPITTRQLIGSTLTLLVIGFGALLAIVGANVWLNERASSYADKLVEIRNMKAAAVELRASVQAAESSARGYLFTNNEIYLAPYDLAKRRAAIAFEQLPSKLAGYSGLGGALKELNRSVAEKLKGMDNLVRTKRGGDDASTLQVIRTNRDKFLMDEINMLLNGITLAGDDHLANLLSEQQANSDWLRLVTIAGGATILVAALGAMAMIASYTRELSAARRELSSSNDTLEQRVRDRTAELAVTTDRMRAARDRAETLLSEVNHRVANSLALVASLVGIQIRATEDAAARMVLEQTQARVQAIAAAHKRLYSGQDVQHVALDDYLGSLLDQMRMTADSESGISLVHDLESITLPTDASINLGVIVTEWVLNAIKYAYPDGRGQVRVLLAYDGEGKARLSVEDDGVGRSDDGKPKGTGVGTRIAKAMAASMRGTIEYRRRSPGTCSLLTFPVTTEPDHNAGGAV